MNIRQISRIARMMILIGGLLGFVMITIARADDVYNFYFQKGSGPQTVVQGGSGQSSAAKAAATLPTTSNEPAPATPQPISAPAANPSPAVNSNSSLSTAQAPFPQEESGNRPFTILLGYGKVADSLGSNMSYSVGLQYNFNRFLGARLQGRFRDTQSGNSNYELTNGNQSANKVGGMLAMMFTPLRLDLLGHRFMEFSAFAGAETYRRISDFSQDSSGSTEATVATGFAPLVGATALLGLNDNVGIELQGSRSTKSTSVSGNLAFQF